MRTEELIQMEKESFSDMIGMVIGLLLVPGFGFLALAACYVVNINAESAAGILACVFFGVVLIGLGAFLGIQDYTDHKKEMTKLMRRLSK